MSEKKRVLVIGYGGAGSQATAHLAKNPNLRVTVVTPFDFMEVTLCTAKFLGLKEKVEEEHDKYMFPLLKEDNVDYVIASCTSLSNSSAALSNGQTIDFDACVVATGLKFPIFQLDPSHPSKEFRNSEIMGLNSSVQKAKHIVISGGGPVGCEAAADIKLRSPDKSVTIVHSHETILDKMSSPFPQLGTKALQDMGVVVLCGRKFERVSDGKAHLTNGESIPCDLLITAHSIGVNTSFMPSNALDDHHFVKVNDNLQVESMNHVFAIGDCSNRDPIKIYPKIEDQLPTVVYNVDALTHNKPMKIHIRGQSFMGQLHGPGIVALGHGHPQGYGLGPDLPGCMGWCLWCCCCFGGPCSPPAGASVAKIKSDFNASVTPKKGLGIHR